MRTSRLFKGLAATGAAVALSLGMSSQASAAPGTFQVTPSVLGGPATPFNANQIAGISSSLLTFDSVTNTVSGSGYIEFGNFALNNVNVLPGKSGLGTNYDLYVTYNYTTDVNGTFGQAGTTNTVTSLTYDVFGAVGAGSTTLTPANAATSTPATAVNGAAQLIGSGSLIKGTAGFDTLGGAFFNSVSTYANTAFGNTFFTAPVPFFNLAFNSFNNTTQGIDRNGDLISINQAVGNVDFNVPEPMTLALLGVGLLGIGASTRRRGKA